MNPQEQNNDLLGSVLDALHQGERLLSGMDDETYRQKVPVAFDASIGGHYRHCLDHFRSLLDSIGSGGLDYDHRERGTLVEFNRLAALEATRELINGWENIPGSSLSRSFTVTCRTNHSTGASQSAGSTVAREIMYAVIHAVHHYALIGVMAGIMGVELPEGFGVAPSTLKHRMETASA